MKTEINYEIVSQKRKEVIEYCKTFTDENKFLEALINFGNLSYELGKKDNSK